MTQQEALAKLQLPQMPQTEEELVQATQQVTRALTAKFPHASPAEKQALLDEMVAIGKARDMLFTDLNPAAPPSTSWMALPRQQPAASLNPSPQNRTPAFPHVRPLPTSSTSRACVSTGPAASWSPAKIGKSLLGFVAVMLLIGGAAWGWTSIKSVTGGTAKVQFQTWPAVRVFAEGNHYMGEAPSSEEWEVPTGLFKTEFTIKPKDGRSSWSFRARVRPGRVYIVRVEQNTKTFTITEKERP